MPLTATAGLAMATRQVSSSSTRLRLRGAAFPLRRVCCRQRDDGHWKTPTLVAALYIDRMTAPYAIDGAMDGPSFLSYVEQVLTPTLRKGDIVFIDNLRTHKIVGVHEAIEAMGATVRYLLNPIEQVFPKLKAALRKGAARTGQCTPEARRQAREVVCT